MFIYFYLLFIKLGGENAFRSEEEGAVFTVKFVAEEPFLRNENFNGKMLYDGEIMEY